MQRLLPPTLVLVLIVVSVIVGVAVPIIGPLSGAWRLAGLVPLVVGLWLNLGGAGLFSRLDTNIRTFDEPGRLVTAGPFRFSRNPMYLGFMAVLAGVALLVGSLSAWMGPVAFFGAANFWYIPFEEARMRSNFGDDYDHYRSRVRRWVGPVRTA